MKKLTKEQLRARRIFNPWNLAEESGYPVLVSYSPQISGRAYRSARWQVIHIKKKTDPKAQWDENGHKTFHLWSKGEKMATLQEALWWAEETFGIKEWERDPWGDYHPLGALEAAAKLPVTKQ